MTYKIGRNTLCPCGSGKKYKHCCAVKEEKILKEPLPSGRFRYEFGSYGGSGSYRPSIIGYKETESKEWIPHLCLVKVDALYADEESASIVAEKHLTEARSLIVAGKSVQEFALPLRHEGYKSVTDFNVVKTD